MPEEMLSVDQVARLLGVSTKTIRRAIDAGRLRASKPCGLVRVAPSDVTAWLEASRVEPRATPRTRERASARGPTTGHAGGLRELLDQENRTA